MENGMSHMMKSPSSISWIFTVIILAICALIVFHIGFTFWKQQNHLRRLKEQHNTLSHSLTMSLGMISTLTICSIIAAKMTSHQSSAYIVGLIAGIIVSGIISYPFKRDIAALDGIVSGTMGGLMGVMLGLMVPTMGMYVVAIILTILFAVTWFIMRRNMYDHFLKTNYQQIENLIGKTEYF